MKVGDLVVHKYGEEIMGFYQVICVRGFCDSEFVVADLLNVHTGKYAIKNILNLEVISEDR